MGRNYSNVGSWHLRWQNEMLESCHNKGQIEKHFDFGKIHHIVDFQLKNICMEFQHSILHSIDFRKRSEFYTLNDKKLIWIFDVREDFRRGHLKILSEDTQTKKAKISWSTYQECLNYFSPKMSKNVEVYLEIKNDKTDFLPELLKITWAAPNNIGAMNYISDFKKPFYAKKVNFDDLKATLNSLYDKNHDDDGLRYSRDFLDFEKRWT